MLRCLGIGCLVIAAVSTCTLCTLVLSLQAAFQGAPVPTMAEEPVDISGACSAEAVIEYEAGMYDRLNLIYEPFGILDGRASNPIQVLAAINAIDEEDLRHRRAQVARIDVPPCLEDLQAEELALADIAIESGAYVRGGRPGAALRLFATTWQSVDAILQRSDRMQEGYERLEERLGIELDDEEQTSSSTRTGCPPS